MKNILLVLKREYLTRVTKKTFLLMTFLTPILIAAISIIPGWLASRESNEKKIEIVDANGQFKDKFKNTNELKYFYSEKGDLEKAKTHLKADKVDLIVFIPKDIYEGKSEIKIYAEKNVSLELKMKIEGIVEKEIENVKLLEARSEERRVGKEC